MDKTMNHSENSDKEYCIVQGLVGETSFSIVLPKSYAIDLGIGKWDFVMVSKDGNRLIVERVRG